MSVCMVINMNISVRGTHQLLCGNKGVSLSSVTSYTVAGVCMSVFFLQNMVIIFSGRELLLQNTESCFLFS